jgi:hypothetical protein
MGGPKTVLPPGPSGATDQGNYGAEYVFSASNEPGYRGSAVSWTDSSGVFWMFGGHGFDSAGDYGFLNDLWAFDSARGAHGEWAWMGGSKIMGATATYGTEFAFSADNMPPALGDAMASIDANGRVWFFGGGNPNFGISNDLWVFDPAQGTHGEWAWIGNGPQTCAKEKCERLSNAGTVGQFAAGFHPGGREHCTAWFDPDGRFWIFGGDGYDSKYSTKGTLSLTELWVFDPSQGSHGEWAWMGGTSALSYVYSPEMASSYGIEYQFADGNWPGQRAGAISWNDSNGNLWLFGGLGYDSTSLNALLNDLWVFDPRKGTHGQWSWMGGSSAGNQSGVYGTGRQFAPGNMPGGRYGGMGWIDSIGRFWLLGGFGSDKNGREGDLNDLWVFDPHPGNHGEWAWMGGSAALKPNPQNGSLGLGQPGVYGTEYEFDSANYPGSRVSDDEAAFSWRDAQGNLWMFSGSGYGDGSVGWLKDLWEFRFFTPQTISFTPPATPVVYGAAPIPLSATASSGLAVAFQVTKGPGTITTNGSSSAVEVTGAGQVIVAAFQPGDSEFSTAPVVKQIFWVNKALLNVKADDLTLVWGQTIPPLTWTPSGFVNGDSALSALTGAPQLQTSAVSDWAPGVYPIRISKGSLAAANYGFTFQNGTLTIQPLGVTVAPTFTPAAGTYSGAQTVQIGDAMAPLPVYYTTDGSTPSSTHGTRYTGPFTVSASETVKAVAVKTGYSASAVASAAYTIH